MPTHIDEALQLLARREQRAKLFTAIAVLVPLCVGLFAVTSLTYRLELASTSRPNNTEATSAVASLRQQGELIEPLKAAQARNVELAGQLAATEAQVRSDIASLRVALESKTSVFSDKLIDVQAKSNEALNKVSKTQKDLESSVALLQTSVNPTLTSLSTFRPILVSGGPDSGIFPSTGYLDVTGVDWSNNATSRGDWTSWPSYIDLNLNDSQQIRGASNLRYQLSKPCAVIGTDPSGIFTIKKPTAAAKTP